LCLLPDLLNSASFSPIHKLYYHFPQEIKPWEFGHVVEVAIP
jgi:hypothetical protein